MKENLTEVVFILDRSGSMSGLEKDTIGGYNGLLEKQKKIEGEAIVSTILFDDQYEVLHDRVNICNIQSITDKQYFVRGCTALYDAIGNTIDNLGYRLSETDEKDRPAKVMFIIITDGMENASREYSHNVIKNKIKHQKEKYSWEFIFLGCNFDAERFAETIGIQRDRAATYRRSSKGIQKNYAAVDLAIKHMRVEKQEALKEDWKNIIKEEE
jgi:uncharacterized protein YegL